MLSVLIVFLIILPVDRIVNWAVVNSEKDIVLSELDKEQQTHSPEKLKEIEKSEPAAFEDDEDIAKKKLLADQAAQQNTQLARGEVHQIINKNQQPSPTPAPPTPTNSVAVVAKQNTQPPVVTPEPSKKAVDKKSEGFIYRGNLVVSNLDMVGPKMKAHIEELGGRKAGEVELGWMKNSKTSYFHFTIPEAKYNELIQYFQMYGKPNITKQPHPRVMPDGILRLIITIEDNQK